MQKVLPGSLWCKYTQNIQILWSFFAVQRGDFLVTVGGTPNGMAPVVSPSIFSQHNVWMCQVATVFFCKPTYLRLLKKFAWRLFKSRHFEYVKNSRDMDWSCWRSQIKIFFFTERDELQDYMVVVHYIDLLRKSNDRSNDRGYNWTNHWGDNGIYSASDNIIIISRCWTTTILMALPAFWICKE